MCTVKYNASRQEKILKEDKNKLEPTGWVRDFLRGDWRRMMGMVI